MAIIPMNTGLAAAGMVLATGQGRMRNASAVSRWLGGYKAKGLAASVFVNSRLGSDDIIQGSGSEVAPFKTIDAAVAAMGRVKTLAGYEAFRTLVVQGGVHDVSDVTLPMGRWIVVLQGGAFLTGPLGFELLAAEAFASTDPPTLAIINDDAVPAGAGFDSVVVTQGAGAVVTAFSLYARNCAADELVEVPAATTGLSVELERCSVGELLDTNAIVVAFNSAFARNVSVESLTMQGGILNGDVTVTAASTFMNTEFAGAGTFTGPALSARLDGVSNFFFKTNGWALAGGATKVIIDDDVA